MVAKKGLGILFIVVWGFLPACAPTEATVLQHPDTLQTVECKRNPWKNWTWQDEEVRRKCADKYKALGFAEVNKKSPENNPVAGASNASLTDKLQQLEAAYSKGLLTESEYKAKRKQILERF